MLALSITLAIVASASAQTCVKPYSGQLVYSLTCSQPGAGLNLSLSSDWDPNVGGRIEMPGTPFCLNVSSQQLSDGEPPITLATCDPNSAFQKFTNLQPLQPNPAAFSAYASHVDGSCLDLVSGTQAPNESLELYGCNGDAPSNQCVRPSQARTPAAAAASLTPSLPLPTPHTAGSFNSLRRAAWWCATGATALACALEALSS